MGHIGAAIPPEQAWGLFCEGAAVIITIFLLLVYARMESERTNERGRDE